MTDRTEMTEKTKICAYCRVSTKDKEQLNSMENQKSYFLREFGESENCELVRLYADVGRSGTSLHRPDFDRMILDAGIDKTQLDGDLYRIVAPPKFRRILVKNTSRFARNVSSDMLIKTLSVNNVFIDFVDTGLSTERPGDLLTLQLLQALDEHESRDKSRKIIFGMQEGVRNGVILSHGNFYGYRYHPKPENRLEAIPEEAEVIRLIFRMYTVDGYGSLRICGELAARGIRTRKGAVFHENTILKMLRNPIYTGCGIRNKYQGQRIFSAQTFVANPDAVVFETDRIDPIIDSATFARAQSILDKRARHEPVPYQPGRPSIFSGKVYCGICGSPYYVSGSYYLPNGTRARRYYCSLRLHKLREDPAKPLPFCDNVSVIDPELFAILSHRDFKRALKKSGRDPDTLSDAEKMALVRKLLVFPNGKFAVRFEK